MKKILIPIIYFFLSVFYTLLLMPFVIIYIIFYWVWTFKLPDLTFETPKYFEWSVYCKSSLMKYKSIFHYIWDIDGEYIR